QRLRLGGRPDLAFGGKLQRFLKVLARADDRPANRQPFQHHVEDRRRELTRRQTDQHAGAASAEHADRLLEGLERNGGDEDGVRATDGTLRLGGGIGRRGGYSDFGTEGPGPRVLAIVY